MAVQNRWQLCLVIRKAVDLRIFKDEARTRPMFLVTSILNLNNFSTSGRLLVRNRSIAKCR
jgi:hypothetical protein